MQKPCGLGGVRCDVGWLLACTYSSHFHSCKKIARRANALPAPKKKNWAKMPRRKQNWNRRNREISQVCKNLEALHQGYDEHFEFMAQGQSFSPFFSRKCLRLLQTQTFRLGFMTRLPGFIADGCVFSMLDVVPCMATMDSMCKLCEPWSADISWNVPRFKVEWFSIDVSLPVWEMWISLATFEHLQRAIWISLQNHTDWSWGKLPLRFIV